MTADGERGYCLRDELLLDPDLLRVNAGGVDAGLTLTKGALGIEGGVRLFVRESDSVSPDVDGVTSLGVTGARAAQPGPGQTAVQEIEAAARGVRALLPDADDAPFVLALAGTGTAFALVRGDAVSHLGGTALGGGSFTGIARRLYPELSYDDIVRGAARGDRRRADVMVSDAYPDGIGRIGPDLTAAHLAKPDGALDDVLAALLNMHGENIGQIAASRAVVAQARRVVLAGGFVHNNATLVASLAEMIGRFGVRADAAPAAGFVGAIGAAIVAAERAGAKEATA
ncbi:MAG TPA: hypothetical protein VFY79_14220 [Dehalococcoidia bacterium]|nr:hypothetical protein [Dehalococcoidia bacterium]